MIVVLLALALLQDAVEKTPEAIVMKLDGKPLVRYQLKKPADSALASESACYFHPLATPKGLTVTDVAPSDHKHHRGVFFAWLEMHGKKDADFWGWGMYAPTKDRVIVNSGQIEDKAKTFTTTNHWKAEGETLLTETLTAAARIDDVATVLTLEYKLEADADLKLSKWAFSGFCLRLRKDGKAVMEDAEGEVKLPPPSHMKPETDWPSKRWYACSMTLPDGSQVGGAVINHEDNPKTLWHNVVGIRMINPCIVAPGEVVLKAKEPLILKYRVLAYDGPTPKAMLTALSSAWPK